MNFDKSKSGIDSVSSAVMELASKMDSLSDKQVSRIISVGSVFSGGAVAKTSPAQSGVSAAEPSSPNAVVPSSPTDNSVAGTPPVSAGSVDVTRLSEQVKKLTDSLNKFANRNVVLNMTSRGQKIMVAKVEEEIALKA